MSEASFTQTYLDFVERIRVMYATQPIFVFTPWGWPQPDGPNTYYYPNAYADVVAARHALGDEHVFLVNTTGWVDYSDVFPGYAISPAYMDDNALIHGLLTSGTYIPMSRDTRRLLDYSRRG